MATAAAVTDREAHRNGRGWLRIPARLPVDRWTAAVAVSVATVSEKGILISDACNVIGRSGVPRY